MMACADDDQDKDKEKDENKPKPICPQVVIVRELDRISDYGTESPDPTQLVAKALMNNVNGDCAYQKDGIDIAFDLTMVAVRGPRLGGNHVSLPYFIAVADPDHKILQKELMTADFHISNDEKTVEKTESLHVVIPVAKDKTDTGPNYQVLLGFQLTEEQIKAVREKEDVQFPEPTAPPAGLEKQK